VTQDPAYRDVSTAPRDGRRILLTRDDFPERLQGWVSARWRRIAGVGMMKALAVPRAGTRLSGRTRDRVAAKTLVPRTTPSSTTEAIPWTVQGAYVVPP
jgi:hypothetical protein